MQGDAIYYFLKIFVLVVARRLVAVTIATRPTNPDKTMNPFRNEQYRYTLEPYKGMKTRYTCPACEHKKCFTRYIDTETGQHLDEQVGRCNREVKCGYHYKPGEYLQDNPKPVLPRKPEPPASCTYIHPRVYEASMQHYETNHFVQYLLKIFGRETTLSLISKYNIGSSKHWPGATVFWQMDRQQRLRSGKIMLYNPDTGKRVKEPFSHITWAHTVLKLPDFVLKQCLFGEHLLATSTLPVAIVESEKTAIIASVHLPQFIWLASGSLSNLTADKCQVLKGRDVYLYPDLGAYDKWKARAEELSSITRFFVVDVLERYAAEEDKLRGLDLGDYLGGELTK